MLETEKEIDHSVGIKLSYRQNLRPNHRRQSQDRYTQNGCDNKRGTYRCQTYGS